MATIANGMAASGGGRGSSDSSTDDATKKSEKAAAAGQGGSASRAHVLRSRLHCSLLRRRGRPLSSLVSSISWLIRFTWLGLFAWISFVKYRHGTAYPWAEATGVASRWRTMGGWHSAVSRRLFSFKGLGKALLVCGGGEPVAACRAHFGLSVGLCLAGSVQRCVAHWAGAAVRHSVGEASWC